MIILSYLLSIFLAIGFAVLVLLPGPIPVANLAGRTMEELISGLHGDLLRAILIPVILFVQMIGKMDIAMHILVSISSLLSIIHLIAHSVIQLVASAQMIKEGKYVQFVWAMPHYYPIMHFVHKNFLTILIVKLIINVYSLAVQQIYIFGYLEARPVIVAIHTLLREAGTFESLTSAIYAINTASLVLINMTILVNHALIATIFGNSTQSHMRDSKLQDATITAIRECTPAEEQKESMSFQHLLEHVEFVILAANSALLHQASATFVKIVISWSIIKQLVHLLLHVSNAPTHPSSLMAVLQVIIIVE
jgi:hypothetical protein